MPSASSSATARRTTLTLDLTAHDGGDETRKVSLDGREVEAGRAIEVSPGAHTARVEAPGAAPIERSILVDEGSELHVVVDGPIAPSSCPPNLGGVPPHVEPRGGCGGCGRSDGATVSALSSSALALGAVISRRRRRNDRTRRGG
jgi:hypothetical protein